MTTVVPTAPLAKRDWLTQRTLSSLVRAERAAAERCREAVPAVTPIDAIAVDQLHECMRSHIDRSTLLAAELERAGGEQVRGVGPLHQAAVTWQRAATAVNDRLSLALLRRGERRHRRRYLAGLRKLKGHPYSTLRGQLLPEQERVEALLASLAERGRTPR